MNELYHTAACFCIMDIYSLVDRGRVIVFIATFNNMLSGEATNTNFKVFGLTCTHDLLHSR